MSAEASTRVLVGPRHLNDRICRLVYVGETDEAWTEVWSEDSWHRVPLLVRDVLGAPLPGASVLARSGVPEGRGEWDPEDLRA